MKNRLMVAASLAALSIALLTAGCSSKRQVLSSEKAREALIDRNWVDIWPTKKSERLHVYRFTPSMGGGVYQDRTMFVGKFELFMFEATGEEIRFMFPETRKRYTARYTIEKIDGPKPFTVKLTLKKSPRGPAVYYGWDEKQQSLPFLRR
jgi:hypothetical protein